MTVQQPDSDLSGELAPQTSAAPGLQFDIGRPSPDTVVVQLAGEIDLVTEPLLVATLEHVLDGWPQQVIIGLSHVDFFGSRAVGILAAAHDVAIERGATFCLIEPTEMIARVLALTGGDIDIPVYDSMDDALAGT